MCTFMQMKTFHQELESNVDQKEQVIILINKQLQDEIALFNADNFESIDHPAGQIVKELETYYNSRFYGNV